MGGVPVAGRSLSFVARRLRKEGSDAVRELTRGVFKRGHKHFRRGLKDFDRLQVDAGLPTLSERIEARLRTTDRCKVLEFGCGEGRMLLDLLGKYGTRVELHGINHPEWPVLRGPRALARTNAHFGILPRERLRSLPLPTIHAADVQDLSTLPVREFDFVISQTMVQHVLDKALALQQSADVLVSGGMFLHDIDRTTPPIDFLDGDLPRFTVYDDAKRLSTKTFLREHGIEVHEFDRDHVAWTLAVYTKTPQPLRLGLKLDEASSFSLEGFKTPLPKTSFWGARSVYRVSRDPS